MEANTANEASNTAEENQVTETEIAEQAEVEQEHSGEQEPTEDAEENAGEAVEEESAGEAAETANDDVGLEGETVEASEEQANSGNDTEKPIEEEMEAEDTEAKEGENDETAESKDEKLESKEEDDSIEKVDEEKKDESEKVDGAEEKDTEKVNYTNLAPWFNEELHRLCKKNQQLYKRAREHKNQTKIWDEFKNHQNDVHQEIRKVKREYQTKNSLSDEEMAKLSTKSASKAKEYGLLDFDVKVITDGRNLKEPENKGSHKREHGGSWVSPQEKRRREQAMREYYKMYY